MTGKDFILEIGDYMEANKVDLEVYRFERFSETKGVYIFIRRANK